MFVTIINDCADSNESGRQCTRASLLFPGVNVSFMGIHNYSELEAAGNLVDVLDATMGAHGVVMVNSAPRHGSGKKWKNGTPFGYFMYKKTLIVSTVAGMTLSLVKKMGIMTSLAVTDLPTVIDHFVAAGKFPKEDRDRVVMTQFRSYEYMPLLAKWLMAGEDVPHETLALAEIADVPKCVWYVDSFGNAKTTMLPEEIGFEPGKVMETNVGPLTCYNRLKDVGDGAQGMTIGSSGYKQKRFIEITIQGKRASDALGLRPGTVILD